MNAKLKAKHKATDKKLQEIAAKKIAQVEKRGSSGTWLLETVGGNLGVTGQTIRNHIAGKGSDGYLKEAITEELSKR